MYRPMMPQGDYMMSGQHPGYYQGYQMSHPAQMPPLSQVNTQQQMGGTGPGFMLHGQTQSHSLPPQSMYQNGQGYYSPEHQYRGYPPSAQTYASGIKLKQCLHICNFFLFFLLEIGEYDNNFL